MNPDRSSVECWFIRELSFESKLNQKKFRLRNDQGIVKKVARYENEVYIETVEISSFEDLFFQHIPV